MHKLFESWRGFLNEASQLTIDRDIFIKKVMQFIKQQGMDAAEPKYPQDVTGGESVQDIFYMLKILKSVNFKNTTQKLFYAKKN